MSSEVIENEHAFDLEEALNNVDLSFSNYTPSQDALEFFVLMRLVEGADFEFDTPIAHYFIIDLLFGNITRDQYPYNKETREKLYIDETRIGIMISRGCGKLQSAHSRLLTPSGWTTMGEIQVGDDIITRGGTAAKVKWKTDPQRPKMYKMTLSDGTVLEVGDEHRHIVHYRGRNGMNERVVTTQEMYDAGISKELVRKTSRDPKYSYKYRIPLCSPVEFTEQQVAVDPYVMGLGLANASFISKGELSCHADDGSELCEYIREAGYTDLKTKTYGDNAMRITFGKNIYKTFEKVSSRGKYIPKEYMIGSVDQRIELLRGLMDGDGSIATRNKARFTSYSKQLAHDVRDLVRSLGGICKVGETKRKAVTKVIGDKEYHYDETIEYIVNVNLKMNPFKLKRKAEKWSPTNKISKTVVGLEPMECVEDGYCISVDSPCESYITEGYTVTHNSTVITAFFPVYCAIKGIIPNYGKVRFMVLIGASAQGGARTMMKAIASMCEESVFCNEWFESMRFTETEFEVVRKGPGQAKHRTFLARALGAKTPVRGIRDNASGSRPDCHVRGTIVTTEHGMYPVEEHPGYKSEGHFEECSEIAVCGLPEVETVSKNHKYWARLHTTDNKEGIEVAGVKADKYTMYDPSWVSVSDMVQNRYWIGTPIDTTVGEIQPIEYSYKVNGANRSTDGKIAGSVWGTKYQTHPSMQYDEFWWIYGLWLGDGTLGNRGIITLTIANSQEDTVGAKVLSIYKKLNIRYNIQRKDGAGCYVINTSDTALWVWLKAHKAGNSIKNMPDWVLKLDTDKHLQILLGYIAADGYIDRGRSPQVRINSVNRNVLNQLQTIANRLGLPSHIRNTKQAGTQTWFNGVTCDHKQQWEIRFKDNVESVLGIDGIPDSKGRIKQVFLADGMLWRKVKSIQYTNGKHELIPIQCNNHTLYSKVGTKHAYTTLFGVSKNCIIFDDAVPDSAAANSETQMEVLKANIEADAGAALKGGDKGKIILVFTPFNLRDPNTSALVNGQFTPVAFPICEKIDNDMTKAEWKGLWPEMHSYESVKRMYLNATKSKSSMRAFMQERMLRLASSDDRMVPDELLSSMWYDRKDILEHIDDYRLYMTTDLTSSSEAKGDFAGMAVWAVGPEGDMFMLGLSLRKQSIGDQYDSIFNLVQIYGKGSRSIEVGVEVDGNQRTHIYALEGEMRKRGIWFTFARQKGAGYGSKGILSRKAGGNKHERFRLVLPMLQDNKIWLPNELKDTPDMKELIHELENVTYEGFSSAHDDGCDLISQTIAMEVVVPPKRYSLGNSSDEEDVWGDIERDDVDAYAGYTD